MLKDPGLPVATGSGAVASSQLTSAAHSAITGTTRAEKRKEIDGAARMKQSSFVYSSPPKSNGAEGLGESLGGFDVR
jgi:hypothetical protein